MTPDLRGIADTVRQRFDCAAVILYGSRAAGRHRADSDVDLVGLRHAAGHRREVLEHGGLPVDLSLYGETDVATLPAATLRYFAEGIFLAGDESMVADFLSRARMANEAGPSPLTDGERHGWRVWAEKMTVRILAPGDPAAALYRRGWLAQQLYELHYHLRGRWDPKIDEGFAAMRRDGPGLLALFEAAQSLPPGPALRETQQALIERVFGP